MTGTRAPEHTVTRCGACGQTVVALAECVCGHSVLVHEVNRKDARTRCEAGAGLAGCECVRYQETSA